MPDEKAQLTLFGEAIETAETEAPTEVQNGKRSRKAKEPATSKQQLSAMIKSVRDLLRKDPGLSGDTDRLPQLTWMLFLKLLDDYELSQEMQWGPRYVPIIKEGMRWRDWAANSADPRALRGDSLVKFVNDDLIPYLSELSSTGQGDLSAIVGQIFQGTYNRIRSGFILRDVISRLSTVNFNASDDIYAISHFYETMLREMRDSAGDSGEFYTPRPVVRFIIDRLNPQPGERVLDPACGTGGFLVETWERLKESAQNPEQRQQLMKNIMGIEKKSMPYLLGVMNLLLHGIDHPSMVERNALQTSVTLIAESDQVEVIATNPPFGGEEEQGIVKNFPAGLRTQETALLFFQFVMAMLKQPSGRCGVVLPNGFLFGNNGIAIEIKKRLLKQFNLHTIVRLPKGVFAPYTDIPANLLFFEACEPNPEQPCTREVWYYEQPLPEGRNSYSKTRSLQYEEFADCLQWWDHRDEPNERAWRVPYDEIAARDFNLDWKNPNRQEDAQHLPPEQLIESALKKAARIQELLGEIKEALERETVRGVQAHE